MRTTPPQSVFGQASRRNPFRGRLGAAAIIVCASALSVARADDARRVGSAWQLLVDDWLIASAKDARLTLHSPQLHDPVFTFDAPWEGSQSGYVTMIKDGDRFRMYYRGGGDLVREYTCLAESDDGIRWTRPKLGLFEFNKSKDNNIIWTGERKAYFESHNFCPFIDRNPKCDPSQRYKAVSSSRPGKDRKNALMAFASADGIKWKRLRDEPIITEGAFDSQNTVFWDETAKQYVCYFRAGQQGKRSIARTTSADFLNWTKPELLDFGGTPIEHLYTNGMLPYFRSPELYIGLPMRFVPPQERDTVGFTPRKTDGFSDAVFMSSHDGLHWLRPFMEAWIRPGLDPLNWGGAHGNSTPAWGILQTGKAELSVYWSEHYDNYPKTDTIPYLRRGTLRLDGFASMRAGYNGGEFTTKPLVFQGKRLVLNLSTSAVGAVKVEIQDAAGQPIAGYGLADCAEIFSDELERPVGWKAGADVSKLAGKPVRLRFTLKDADVYAFRFEP